MVHIYIDTQQNGCYEQLLSCQEGSSLYQALTDAGVSGWGAVCRGAGVCRGCLVYIVEEGMECLACRYTVRQDIHIRIPQKQKPQTILLSQKSEAKIPDMTDTESPLGIALDIGTTTIASALVELTHGQLLAQAGCMNRQALQGADVMSRIQYASQTTNAETGTEAVGMESGLDRMHEALIDDITVLLNYYKTLGYSDSRIKRISYSGNTTMLHFLLHESVEGMTGYPFTPEFLDGRCYEQDGRRHLILPGKSAFVGADVAAGVQYLNMGQSTQYELLIDLGTNGELWLLNCEQGVCTSASCGPAFANSVKRGSIHGTALLDQLAAAYQNGSVSQDGLLQGAYFKTGIPCGEYVITQDTVRELQLAKAAICTGIELVAYELRIPLTDICRVYVAGGFGFHLNLEAAFILGLFPKELKDKIEIVGNTSLDGAIEALLNPDNMLTLPKVLQDSRVLDLSMSKNFQEFFLHRIPFPELKEKTLFENAVLEIDSRDRIKN